MLVDAEAEVEAEAEAEADRERPYEANAPRSFGASQEGRDRGVGLTDDAEMADETETLMTWDTGFSADSCEWCPALEYQNVLAIGTYQVEQAQDDKFRASQRKGKLVVHEVSADHRTSAVTQVLDFAPVLDMKWDTRRGAAGPLLAVADALGFVTLLSLKDTSRLLERTRFNVSPHGAEDGDCLALSLALNDRKEDTEDADPLVAVSDSKGHVNVLRVSEDGLTRLTSRRRHQFEAWTTCFDADDHNVIISGGDDSRLKAFDLRCPDGDVFVSKEHQSGVTSVLSVRGASGSKLFSGSYDEMLLEWDTRNMRRPVAGSNLGGGVWRIKEHPTISHLLATACMGNGVKVLDTRSHQLLAHFLGHQSLAYGLDWMRGETEKILSSCSFYDHLLCIWRMK